MATITSAQSGNFNDTATWIGGVVPIAGDIAVAATGHIVVINVNTTVSKVTQTGTGKFTLGNGITLTADVEASSGTFTTGGTVDVICTAGQSATINGNIFGAAGAASVNVAAVVITGAGSLTINGNVTSSTGDAPFDGAAYATVYTNVTCTININGSLTAGTGGFKRPLQTGASSNATINIVGNVSGGSGQQSHGVFVLGASPTVNITGSVTGGTGTIANTYGVGASGVSAIINITGNVTSGTSSGSSNFGVIVTGASAIINITGNVTSGATTDARAVYSTGATSVINITGNVTGGIGSNSFGVYNTGASSLINIIGVVTGINNSGHGVRSDATSLNFGVRLTGSLVDSSSGVTAIFTRFMKVADNSGITQYSDIVSSLPVYRVDPANVTGMPSANNVRSPLVYGYNNELTGTLVVPAANTVTLGVVYDNGTVGTAQNTAATFLAALSASTDPLAVRLQNVATVQTTGDQIAAASPS